MDGGDEDSEAIATLRGHLAAMPGAAGTLLPSARGVTLYKVMGKMFAILFTRPSDGVILKCDPYRAEMLREQYKGVGHRSHLDPRHWIAIDLHADVPVDEIEDLARHSYDLVCAGLTRKQRAELAG
ncbi:MmcQ/YjbR family DNA-binding protein [Sphingomonas sp. MMS24-J13]|uniref:MmcQ/YjbR family DNA-binding protein n=1 Tax=Sphingomonas sp. MMS24-J13 TaxID=3238686 RepID=UPI00384C47B9